MSLISRAVNAINAFQSRETAKNDAHAEPNNFLRYGNRNKPMYQNWSQVEMSDQDMYTGYAYAAIKNRANRAAILGKTYLKTEASKTISDAAKERDQEIVHPYLELIRSSKEFTQKQFWHDISVYLDLEGVYYLMAVRAVSENRDGTSKVGAVQKFVLLNPYTVRRVIRQSDGTIGGYVESKNGLYREIPPEMIIEIRQLNPFNNDEPYSMTDASKESQFVLKQAGDYARHSIEGNINSPGAITTDVELEDPIFDNFVSRIRNHSKGEPIYGNGAGSVNWESMQIDLDKAALDKVNEIHRQVLFAVSGVSKTTLGIEESGTTRDTSMVQRDNFTENAVMPQVEDILDALNMDYRKWYAEWEKDRYEIVLDNPLQTDREAELKDIEISGDRLKLREQLVNTGYEYDIAARYAAGEITIEELGEPTLEPELTIAEADELAAQEAGILIVPPEDGSDTITQTSLPKIVNAFDPEAIVKGHNPNRNDKTGRFGESGAGAMNPREKLLIRWVAKEENEKRIEEARKRLKARLKKHKAKKTTETTSETAVRESKDEPKSIQSGKSKVEIKINEVEETVANQISARDYPSLYDDLDIDTNDLGCIMINTEKIPVVQFVKKGEDDLVESTDRHEHTMGAVSEVEPHATLLYGLLENGNVWKDKVDQLLEGWNMPTVTIQEVSYFDTPDSYAVVAKLEKTPEIVDGHERLTLLPHVNTFSEYQPHITLAYIKKEADVDKWVKALGKKYNGQIVATNGINYGDEPDEDDSDDSDSTQNNIDDEHRPPLNKDFYDDLPGGVCAMLDDIAKEYGHADWFLEAWNKYRDHVLESDIDNMMMPGYIFGDYIKEKNDFSKDLVKNSAYLPTETSPKHVHNHNHYDLASEDNPTLEKALNELSPTIKDDVILQEANLQNAVSDLDQRVVNKVIEALREGNVEKAEDIISEAQQGTFINELALLLAGYYTVLFPIYAAQLFANRLSTFNKQGVFAMTNDVEAYINDSARDAAESHIQTIIRDIMNTVNDVSDKMTREEMVNYIKERIQVRDEDYTSKFGETVTDEDIKKAVNSGKFDKDPAYKFARDRVREGAGQLEVERAIRNEYQDISKNRAKTIAKHEASRVFNMSQYQADLQFLTETNNMDVAYKRLRSRSGNPCPVCSTLIAKTTAHPIPFNKNFADLGDELTATYRRENGKLAVQKVPINYEAIKAGNVHVNCNCEYELVIKQEDGSFLNDLDARTNDSLTYNKSED